MSEGDALTTHRIARAARPVLIVASAITLAVAAILSATHEQHAIAAPPEALPKIRTIACPEEARAIESRARCGFVRLPLDRENPAGDKIRIYFELYPRRDRARPAVATLLSIEGGPGFPTTADRDARAEVWRPVVAPVQLAPLPSPDEYIQITSEQLDAVAEGGAFSPRKASQR